MTLGATIGLASGSLIAALMLRFGHSPLILTPWLALLFLVIGIILLGAGLQVKRLKSGKSTTITALHAARIALFARSSAINGAAFTAFLLGVLLISLTRLWAKAVALAALNAGIAAAGALVMTILAVVVERWCLDDMQRDGDKNKTKKDNLESHSDGKAHGQA